MREKLSLARGAVLVIGAHVLPGSGMPSASGAREQEHGLDPANPDDSTGDPDADGYTNIEEYLNATDPRRAA